MSFLSKSYANAAVVGSLIILKTSNPAIFPASFVVYLCASLKYAGIVITDLLSLLSNSIQLLISL